MDKRLQLKDYFYKGFTVSYRADTEDEKVLSHSFDKDIFYKEIPSFNPGKSPVIVDVGAHIGTFSLLSLLKYPEANVYSYEASSETFSVLKKNKDVNQLSRLHVFHKAVAGRKGHIKLFHSQRSGNWGHSITKELSNSFEPVEATTLEEIIREHEIESIDLIKFNCEGAEFDILLNTPQTELKKIQLGVILYHEDLYEHGMAEDLVTLFKKLDFRILKIKKSNARGWLIVWNRITYSWIYFALKAIFRKLKIVP